MKFKRKVYDQLLEWKKTWHGQYAVLLEGARRVGKTTIAEEFAKKEYQSYILVDFSTASSELMDVFSDLNDLDMFFIRLQAVTHVTLIERNSVIIFDEVQLYPKARQAIKHLVKDGRYDYIETGSLISIRKNVKDILLPSEEMKINVYPMDYEEFMWAEGRTADVLKQMAGMKKPIGDSTNRKLMRDFHVYMAVGGMPQAVEAYLNAKNMEVVDRVKREIIRLYEDDIKKIDPSGRMSAMYRSIPSQLALKKKRFVITSATGKQKTNRDSERIFDLIDSKTVLPCWHADNPGESLTLSKDQDCFKLYLSDTGLFTALLFDGGHGVSSDIYIKLLSDKIDTDLGYLYENVMAQMLTARGYDLYYHTWKKEKGRGYYEIDFLLSAGIKIIPFEVKSASIKNHSSIDAFCKKYSHFIADRYLISQKDIGNAEMLKLRPFFLVPFLTL